MDIIQKRFDELDVMAEQVAESLGNQSCPQAKSSLEDGPATGEIGACGADY